MTGRMDITPAAAARTMSVPREQAGHLIPSSPNTTRGAAGRRWPPGRRSLGPPSPPPPRKRCEQREQIQHRPCGDDGVRPVEYPPVTRQKRPAVFHPRGSLVGGFEEDPRPRLPPGPPREPAPVLFGETFGERRLFPNALPTK